MATPDWYRPPLGRGRFRHDEPPADDPAAHRLTRGREVMGRLRG